MRPALVLLTAVVLATPAPVGAQSKAQCRTMVKNAESMIPPAIVNLNRVEGMGEQIAKLKSSSADDIRPSLDRFDNARRNLASALREFIDASRALRNRSEACS